MDRNTNHKCQYRFLMPQSVESRPFNRNLIQYQEMYSWIMITLPTPISRTCLLEIFFPTWSREETEDPVGEGEKKLNTLSIPL